MRRHCRTRLAVAAAILFPLPALAAFECPAVHIAAGAAPTVLTDNIAGSGGTLSEALKSSIRKMQTEGMKNGDIVDRLVVADCTLLDAKPSLTDAERARMVRHFASTVANVIYATPGTAEEDIVVDVSVPLSIYE